MAVRATIKKCDLELARYTDLYNTAIANSKRTDQGTTYVQAKKNEAAGYQNRIIYWSNTKEAIQAGREIYL